MLVVREAEKGDVPGLLTLLSENPRQRLDREKVKTARTRLNATFAQSLVYVFERGEAGPEDGEIVNAELQGTAWFTPIGPMTVAMHFQFFRGWPSATMVQLAQDEVAAGDNSLKEKYPHQLIAVPGYIGTMKRWAERKLGFETYDVGRTRWGKQTWPVYNMRWMTEAWE